MTTRCLLKRAAVVCLGAILALLILGAAAFPRAELPTAVAADTCAQHSISFDATSLERIYLDPAGIIADPAGFVEADPAYRLLAEHRARVYEPFPWERWLKNTEDMAAQSQAERMQAPPFRLHQLITDNRNSLKGFNIVGAFMAVTIEAEMGREALVQTVLDDEYAFVRAYNTVAEDDMQMRWSANP